MKVLVHFLLTILLFTAGCKTIQTPLRFQVQIDTISAANSQDLNHFILIPVMQGVTKDDLQYQEYASYVKKALEDKGFIEASSEDEANLAILVSYGISDPKEIQVTRHIPIWGQTGVSSSSTTGNVNVHGNSANYSSTTTNTPTYGITGSVPVNSTQVLYTRYLLLTAYDYVVFKNTKQERQVWKSFAVSTGPSGDLRRVFPYLVIASRPYLAQNTGQQITVEIYENTPELATLVGKK